MARSPNSTDSVSSLYTTRPDPCDKCRLTACSTLHDYSASRCPLHVCPECGELEALDAQIAEIYDLLIDLANKRRDLKNRINRRHDRISNLPLEIVSHIFGFIADESLRSVVMLGVVCKRWREITLGTPRLWTKITVDMLDMEDGSLPEIIALWGSQSRCLPLSLNVELDEWIYEFHPLAQTSVPLLRSQAHRWKDLKFELIRASPTMDMILTGLEDRHIVDSLTIHIADSTPPEVGKITMKYPFTPERLDIYKFPLSQIPIEWERLTHFTAAFIGADAVIHVVGCARNLQCCFLLNVDEDAGHYPIPASPVTNISINELRIDNRSLAVDTGLLLFHLTLPSLETLDYVLVQNLNDDGEEMGVIRLRAFLDRSYPPLRVFHVHHYHSARSIFSGWCRLLPSITSLELAFRNTERIQDYLALLTSCVELQALPYLRELHITDVDTSSEFVSLPIWNSLASLFPDPEGNEDTPQVVVRPLKTVIIHTRVRSWDVEREIMSKRTHARLRETQQSGVALHVFNRASVDVLGNDIELTFSESEEDSNDENSSESGTEERMDEDWTLCI